MGSCRRIYGTIFRTLPNACGALDTPSALGCQSLLA
jgi:hypothetical protein